MPVICWDFMGNLPFTGNLQEVYGLLYPTSTPKCSHSPTENKYPTRLGLVSKNWSGKGLFLVGEKFAIPHWIEGHVSFHMGYGSLICSKGLQSDRPK